jgi:hypothetical protein
MSSVVQLPKGITQQILTLICKGIGHYLHNESRTVILDLNLCTNEFICFEGDQVSVVDKKTSETKLLSTPPHKSNHQTQVFLKDLARQLAFSPTSLLR